MGAKLHCVTTIETRVKYFRCWSAEQLDKFHDVSMKPRCSFPQFFTFSLRFLCLNVEQGEDFVLMLCLGSRSSGRRAGCFRLGNFIPVPLQGKQGPVGTNS